MSDINDKAILVVSFGTSFPETRKNTIEAIEQDIAAAYPEYRIYRAWTSKIIMKKLLTTEHLKINSVTEAFEAMKQDGIREVIVQPTHMINGIENDLMKQEALAFSEQFTSIRFGTPLLTTEEDNIAIVEALLEEFRDLPENTALIFMGHGTVHYANAIYAALDYRFKDLGDDRFYMGTVEAYPCLESILNLLKKNPKITSILLTPFMIVAGDHANNDMAADEPGSWRYFFESHGYSVQCLIKGLGEYPRIRQMLVQHAAEAMQ